MPRVLGGEPFTDEHMAEMARARGALDLDPTPVGIRYPPDRALDLLIERRPTAAGVELRVRYVERGVATATDVGALNEEVVIFAAERGLRSLVHDDARFSGRELPQRSHPIGPPRGRGSAVSGPAPMLSNCSPAWS